MGLDMYAYLRKYDSSFRNKNIRYPKELQELRKEIKKRNFASTCANYQVGYWRKFNALHSFFVKHCAGGKDDCKPIYVDFETFKDLLDKLKKIKKNHKLASDLLPTQDGFFFGGQEYDEWYFENIDYTIDLFENLLPLLESGRYDLIYEASW